MVNKGTESRNTTKINFQLVYHRNTVNLKILFCLFQFVSTKVNNTLKVNSGRTDVSTTVLARMPPLATTDAETCMLT